jgi:DNA polymerase-1
LEAKLTTIVDVCHDYAVVRTAAERKKLAAQLAKLQSFCFDTETTGLDPRSAVVIGLSFSWQAHQGVYVQLTDGQVHEEDLFATSDLGGMRKEAVAALEPF